MSSEPQEGSGPAWPVLDGVFVAGARAQTWALACPPATVLCLRRRRPQLSDYPARWQQDLVLLHWPLTYWQTDQPVQRLHTTVELVAALPKPLVAHCALGLDRAGMVALAVLVNSGLPLSQALDRYRCRGVRLPEDAAMAVLTQFAHPQAEGRTWR